MGIACKRFTWFPCCHEEGYSGREAGVHTRSLVNPSVRNNSIHTIRAGGVDSTSIRLFESEIGNFVYASRETAEFSNSGWV
jgi:hypothetical protein